CTWWKRCRCRCPRISTIATIFSVCEERLSQCLDACLVCWTRGHGRLASRIPHFQSTWGNACRTRRSSASRSTELAELRRHVLADDGRDARRLDECPRPGGPVWRRDAEALVGQQHAAGVRGVRGG